MIINKQLSIKKVIPLDSNYIENYFKQNSIDVLRWAIVKVTDEEFIIDAAICVEK